MLFKSVRTGRLAVLLTLVAAAIMPAAAFADGQSGTQGTSGAGATQTGVQSGTSGSGDGSQSGDVGNSQGNIQVGSGGAVQQNATNQNCVAGRDCVNNNITNQNQSVNAGVRNRVFEREARFRRGVVVRHVGLAFTGLDLRLLFLVGGVLTAGGLGVLTATRRGWTPLRRTS